MKKIFLTLCAAALCLVPSCVPLDTPPYDRETDLNYWDEDPNAAFSALNSCYTSLTGMYELVYGDGMTDNAYVKGGQNQTIGNGSFGTSDGYVQSVWNQNYSGIRACCEVLTNIDRVTSLDAALKARYIAEAKTLHAFHYYELYSRFGGVPWIDKPISIEESRTISRDSRETVVANVINELKEVLASNALPASYSGNDRGRVTKWAAAALLARVYLFEGNWTELKSITDEIISDSGATLFPSYTGLFEVANEYCSEILLATQYTLVSREHDIMYNIVPPSLGGYSNLAPLQELVDSYVMLNGKAIGKSGSGYDAAHPFDNRDPRLAATVIYTGNSYPLPGGGTAVIDCENGSDGFNVTSDVTPTGYYIRKWWDTAYRLTLHSGLNAILIRYADVLLMNAEANVELGSFDAAVWNKTIRPIRERAGFTDAAALDFPAGADFRALVRNERRSELAFEGARRADIIRWKIAQDVLNGWCHGIYTGAAVGTDDGFVRIETRQFLPEKHYLWPIPQKERDMNKNLEQNPNW